MITQSSTMINKNNDIHWQKFEVPYEFPVCFSEDVFNKNNKIFLDIIRKNEKDKRHNIIFFIDEGLTKHNEGLITELKQYIDQLIKIVRFAQDNNADFGWG